jgi:glycosyltransferase involved in cell wall biosynthesis
MKNKKPQNPDISVVIPVYNGEAFLDETVQAVLDQTFKNFELILVNDGSTDHSWEMMKKYAKKDKRVILLKNPQNMGPIHTRNNGIRIARGKYLAILDADDVCLPRRFEIQYNYLETHPKIFMVGGSAIVINEKGDKVGVFLRYNNPDKIAKKMAKLNCMIHTSIMYRNEKGLFYRPRFLVSDDYDFMLRAISSGKKVTNLPVFLIKYRVNQNSVTFVRKNQFYFFQKAREFHQQRLRTGRDDYESLQPPEGKISVNPDESKLRIAIIAEFQDSQGRKVRRDITEYFKKCGFNYLFLVYYVLSFFSPRLYGFLRQKF